MRKETKYSKEFNNIYKMFGSDTTLPNLLKFNANESDDIAQPQNTKKTNNSTADIKKDTMKKFGIKSLLASNNMIYPFQKETFGKMTRGKNNFSIDEDNLHGYSLGTDAYKNYKDEEDNIKNINDRKNVVSVYNNQVNKKESIENSAKDKKNKKENHGERNIPNKSVESVEFVKSSHEQIKKESNTKLLSKSRNDTISVEKDLNKTISVDIEEEARRFEKDLDKFINSEMLSTTESFIEYDSSSFNTISEKISSNNTKISNKVASDTTNLSNLIKSNVIAQGNIFCRDIDTKNELSEVIVELAPRQIYQYESMKKINDSISSPLETMEKINDSISGFVEEFDTSTVNKIQSSNDIENKIEQKENIKKIDIKNHNYNIDNMNSIQYSNTTMDINNNSKGNRTNEKTNTDDLHKTIEPSQKVTEVTNDSVPKSQSIDNEKLTETNTTSASQTETKESKESEKIENEWPSLSIDQILITFRVIGDLKEGTKLQLVDNTHLAEDNSYAIGLTRAWKGQGREKIISFLEHLLLETKRNMLLIIANIRNGMDIDNNISKLLGFFTKLHVFLHKYDVVRAVYKSDTGTYARLGVIRDNFFTFSNTFFRDLVLHNKE